MTRALAILWLAAFAACKYPALDSLVDGTPGGEKCTTSSQCPSVGFPVCAPEGKCVECTTADAHLCVDQTPVCTKNQCAACTVHTDCPESNVCLPTGACARSTDVAYVDGDRNVDSVNCTKIDPCNKIDKALSKKPIVKVSGTVQDRPSLNSRIGMILADPGAILRPMVGDSGAVLSVLGTSNLQIYDLQISNGTAGNTGIGISLTGSAKLSLTRVSVRDNSDRGIAVTGSGNSLTCTRCTLVSNAAQGLDASTGTTTITQSTIGNNAGGGIHINGSVAFHIIGNFIYQNGQNGRSNASGINIAVNAQVAGAPENELKFNSITANLGLDTGQGIQCASGTPLIASNNIVWMNGGTPVVDAQVTGNQCSFAYSDIGPTPATGATNIVTDPSFVNSATGDLHLTAASPALGGGDPAANLTDLAAKDIDGEPRVNRPGKGPDLGADQYDPPAVGP